MTQSLLADYLPILGVFLIVAGVVGALVGASLLFARQNLNSQKVAAYDGGFDAMAGWRRRFDVRFFLVGVLFVIIELVVVLLVPWAVSLGQIGLFGFWAMIVFLAIVAVGFAYAWKSGALEWA